MRLNDGDIAQEIELAKFRFDLCQIGIVLVEIDALHIDLNGRGRSETHDLRDDVSRFERHVSVGISLLNAARRSSRNRSSSGMTGPKLDLYQSLLWSAGEEMNEIDRIA